LARKRADPTGGWNIYRLEVTSDDSNPSSSNACPCLGDYPLDQIQGGPVKVVGGADPGW
jgi:hypothetical protein